MRVIKNLSEGEWQEIVTNSEHSTFFHSPIWGSIIEKTYRDKERKARGFKFGENKKAVLPYISHEKVGPVNNIYSMDPGVYGGVVSNFDITENQIRNAIKEIEGFFNYRIQVTGNPYLTYDLDWEEDDDFTQVIDLNRDYNEVWDNYDYSCQKQIKKAEDAGLSVDVASSLEEYKKYYLIYQKNLVRWGKDPNSDYPYSLFENIYVHQEKYPENIKLWLVKDGEKIVGGTIVFYLNNSHSVEWHAVFDPDYFSKGVRNYLVDKIVEDACEKEFDYYDFNPSGGHEGVVRFKSTFGPERREIKRWSKENQRLKSLRQLKSKSKCYLRKSDDCE